MRASNTRKGAIAYVTRDLVGFREGDALVVDASAPAIRNGVLSVAITVVAEVFQSASNSDRTVGRAPTAPYRSSGVILRRRLQDFLENFSGKFSQILQNSPFNYLVDTTWGSGSARPSAI
jgi:hypothetical protein